MSKYTPNTYHLILFDRLGSKIRTELADSFTEAQFQGKTWLSRAECHSFAISRVLYNSAIPMLENYDVKPRKIPNGTATGV